MLVRSGGLVLPRRVSLLCVQMALCHYGTMRGNVVTLVRACVILVQSSLCRPLESMQA